MAKHASGNPSSSIPQTTTNRPFSGKNDADDDPVERTILAALSIRFPRYSSATMLAQRVGVAALRRGTSIEAIPDAGFCEKTVNSLMERAD
jgi:hypothetical protein